METKLLRFKSGQGLNEFHDNDGFVWLEGHEKEKDIEYANHLLKVFPKNFIELKKPVEINKPVEQKKIEDHGVKMLMGTRASEITGDKKVTGVKTSNGEIEADIVVMATGVRPNTTLATAVGIEVGVTRGIMVNPRMETNIEGIYAAGDCVESHRRTDGPGYRCHQRLYQQLRARDNDVLSIGRVYRSPGMPPGTYI